MGQMKSGNCIARVIGQPQQRQHGRHRRRIGQRIASLLAGGDISLSQTVDQLRDRLIFADQHAYAKAGSLLDDLDDPSCGVIERDIRLGLIFAGQRGGEANNPGPPNPGPPPSVPQVFSMNGGDISSEDSDQGTEARFTVITQHGIGWYERGTSVLREELGGIGISLDIAPLEFGTMIQRMLACDYDAMYYRPMATDLDPAGNMDFWLSSGSAHFWNLAQRTAATEWEQRIDTLMLEQAATLDPDRRRQQFNLVQRIFAENLPALYFAAPRMYYAHSSRLRGVVPSVLRPPVLWNADSLSVTN